MEKDAPRADYLLSEDGVIKEIGSGRPLYCDKWDEGVDLGGKTVVPGFIDSHLHMLTGALTKLQIDLNDMKFADVMQMIEYIRDEAPDGKGWIRAFGFSEDNLGDVRLPSKEDIDKIISDRPVIITRVCSHLSIINSAALKLLDSEKAASIEGGEFKKDENGSYSGIITETAQQYVLDNIPAPSEEEIFSKLIKEQDYLLSKGICSIHDAGTDQLPPDEYVELYRKFNETGKLALRTYLMIRPDDNRDFESFAEKVRTLKREYTPERSKLFFGAVKLFADGSLGGKTAAVRRSYKGEKNNRGILLDERLARYIGDVNKAGFQLAIHAIGDRAVEACLNLIEESSKKDGSMAMHRIEHAELLTEDLIKRIKSGNIFIAAQPAFIYEFGHTYRKVLGEDAERIQPLKTLIKRNIKVGFGTDYPIIDVDPLKGIAAAMWRNVKNDTAPLKEKEKLSIEESVTAYTTGSASGSGTEHLQGSLKKGKFADFAVLDKDIYAVSTPEEMEKIHVLATVVGGELLYQKKEV